MRLSSRTASPQRHSSRGRSPAGRSGSCKLEPENEGEKYRCALRCISFGKAYLTVTRAAYLPEDGQLTRDEQENRLVSVDLQTGEEATILEHAENYDLYGVWGDCAVFQVQETAEGAPDFADWAAQQPEEASWDEYERLYIRYRILSRDLRTGWKRRSWTGRSLCLVGGPA